MADVLFRWLQRLTDSIIGGVVTALVLGLVAVVWGLIDNLPGSIIFILFLFTAGSSLLIVHEIQSLLERNPLHLSEAMLEDTLVRWARRSGYATDPPERVEGMLFQFRLTVAEGSRVTVSRLAARRERLVVWTEISPTETERRVLEALPAHLRMELIETFEIELARLGVFFEGVVWPLNRIRFWMEFSIPGLNEEAFNERIDHARRVYFLMGRHFFRVVRGAIPVEQQTLLFPDMTSDNPTGT